MQANVVSIDLGKRSYDIYIGENILSRANDFMPFEVSERKVFIVTDENVKQYVDVVTDALNKKDADVLVLPVGEETKSFGRVQEVCEHFLKGGIDRNSLVIALGGGVIGDLTGFCASITMRGVPYVQIPTSLLAQVDSSVGGKTGINTAQGKNLVGSFYQPAAVIIDTAVLQTLSKRHVRAGYAEIAKYGLINDSPFFNWLEGNKEDLIDLDQDILLEAIEKSVRAKAKIVKADEREKSGVRALLNLGHTFGHALELCCGYGDVLYHGEAVAMGIVMAFDLSRRLELCLEEDVEKVRSHFEAVGLDTSMYQSDIDALGINAAKIRKAMDLDKKNDNDVIKFVLVNGVGEAYLSDGAPDDLIMQTIQTFLDNAKKGERPVQAGKHILHKKSAINLQDFKNKGAKGLWKSVFSSQS